MVRHIEGIEPVAHIVEHRSRCLLRIELGAAALHPVPMRQGGQFRGIGFQQVHKAVVPFRVHAAEIAAVQLVRQAAGAHHENAPIWKTGGITANGLSQSARATKWYERRLDA